MLAELWRIARVAGAGFTDNRVTLTDGDIQDITCEERGTRARAYLTDLCTELAYDWRPGGFAMAAAWRPRGAAVAARCSAPSVVEIFDSVLVDKPVERAATDIQQPGGF